MIRIRGRGVLYGEVWLDEAPPGEAAVDIVIHRQRSAPIGGSRCVPFLSLRTNLALAGGAILEQFRDTCRYQIRRAEAQDDLQLTFTRNPEDRLEVFGAFFDAFAREKSLWLADRQWLRAACRSGQLALSCVSKDGEALAWHAHVLGGTTARLHHSASCFRGKENRFKALVGRANRWLHWKDLLEFGNAGFEYYDWGGMFQDESTPERAGINNFKRSFGGLPIQAYDCTVAATMRGRVWLPLRDAWRRWKPQQPVGGHLARPV